MRGLLALRSYPDNPLFSLTNFVLMDLGCQGLLGCRRLRALFDFPRGYTEQQEWVWSLSSTLGREMCDIDKEQSQRYKENWKSGTVSRM